MTIAAILCVWASSHYWFGPTNLRSAAVGDRLLGDDNMMMERGESVFTWVRNDTSNIRYRCPHCECETKILISGNGQFSAKDRSRFDSFTGRPEIGETDHIDIYCFDCKRPARILGVTKVILGTWANGDNRLETSFNGVVESEF